MIYCFAVKLTQPYSLFPPTSRGRSRFCLDRNSAQVALTDLLWTGFQLKTTIMSHPELNINSYSHLLSPRHITPFAVGLSAQLTFL